MKDTLLHDILHQCIRLEGTAYKTYQQFADESQGQIKHFWIAMAEQESKHILFWQQLSDLNDQGKIKNIFDHPQQILDELKSIQQKVNGLLKENSAVSDVDHQFYLAYQIEFYVMHPAFEAMFHLMRLQTHDPSPEETYVQHIQGFIDAIRKFASPKPEFELISDLLTRLWKSNQQLAHQMADIKQLRGLIPICMHCKNIRNEEGYWEKAEKYMEDHAEIEYSHGICEECLHKHYPDFFNNDEDKIL